jgi:hypothetical protein
MSLSQFTMIESQLERGRRRLGADRRVREGDAAEGGGGVIVVSTMSLIGLLS